MVREMIGGCCVCLDERGWNENPLVYCDGSGCNVAVHQACYGIVKVPSGPWYCCKCQSQERIARVKCELCPLKEGALKRTDTGGWAHVVCALYIPEVRFGDVSTMEPIIFSSVPHERFAKTCFICEENGRESKTASGACMNCHRPSCKMSFHVTCAQSKRQLCEEASINGHVQYVGYCSSHWTRRFKQPTGPVQTHVTEADVKKHIKEKKSRSRTDSTSSNNSVDTITVVKRGRKPKPPDLAQDIKSLPENRVDVISPAKGEDTCFENHSKTLNKAAIPNGQAKCKENTPHSFSVNGILNNENVTISSPLNTPVVTHTKEETKQTESSSKSSAEETQSSDKKTAECRKRKLSEKEKIRKKLKVKPDKLKDKESDKEKKRKEKASVDSKKKEKSHTKDKEKINEKKRKFPQPSQLGLLENGKVSSWDSVTPKCKDTPDNFQAFLEHQWNQSAQFITSKAEHFDVASLLTCLHQLKSDNVKLEKKLSSLQSRRDRLLGVNARLAASITDTSSVENGKSPLSAMLSKLNDEPQLGTPKHKKGKKLKKTPGSKITESNRAIASPDLAMLAAASAKLEGGSLGTSLSDRREPANSENRIPPDEKPRLSAEQLHETTMLLQPNVNFHLPSASVSSSGFVNDMLQVQRQSYNHELFGKDISGGRYNSPPKKN